MGDLFKPNLYFSNCKSRPEGQSPPDLLWVTNGGSTVDRAGTLLHDWSVDVPGSLTVRRREQLQRWAVGEVPPQKKISAFNSQAGGESPCIQYLSGCVKSMLYF